MATGSAGAEKETAPDFVEIDGIAKSFRDRRVLDDVSLGIAPGSLVAVLGASGSGKTTLLRLIAGFERADAGTIRIGGRAVAGPGLHAKVETRGIGYVAQEGALFPHLDVAGNILFGLARHERRDRVRAGSLLETVGLSPAYAGRRPAELSGGEQQRVALARALARRPSLVLLDEPFSALDAALRAETRDAVGRALAASGATALLVTHDQPEALSMGARVAVLRGGRLAQVAEPRTLYRRPVDAALACFVGEAVLLAGEIGGGMARSALGTHAVHVAETWGTRMAVGAACLMLRPEQLVLDAAPRPDGTILAHDTRVTARVVAVAFHGSDARVRLVLTDGTEVTSRVNGHRAPELGAEVAIGVDGEMVAYPPDSLRDQR